MSRTDRPPAEHDGLSDADIIQQSLQDPGRFAGIFERHADEIARYAMARVPPDVAEDVTAETFLAAFRRRHHYDSARADARPWLYGIAIRQIGRHRRAERRFRQAIARYPIEDATADISDRTTEQVNAELLRPRIAEVLSALPQRDRELLLLIAWTDLTYEESAQALGVTVSAVRARLHRIRVKTRKALGGTNPALAQESPQVREETSHG